MSDILQPSSVGRAAPPGVGGFAPDATALAAVDEAARAISSVLGIEEVLQLIVDRRQRRGIGGETPSLR